MNQEVKTKWLEALRSGDYEQAKGSLKTTSGKFCCLGVLCDLYHKETGNGEWNVDGKKESFSVGYDVRIGILPKAVCHWAELDSPNPRIDDAREESLAELNDLGLTFLEITDLIEEQL